MALYVVVAAHLGALAGTAGGAAAGLDVSTREILSLAAPMGIPALLFLYFMTVVGASIRLAIHTDAAAHLAHIALWVLIALLLPYLLSAGARAIVPVAPRPAFEHAVGEAFANRIHDAESRLGRELLGYSGGASGLEALGAAIKRDQGALDEVWTTAVRDARAEVEAMQQDWQERRHRQASVARALSWLSPGTLLLQSIHALAGTGQPLADTWEEAVEQYQDRLTGQLFDDRPRVTIRMPAEAGGHLMRFERRQPPRLHELPQFQQPRVPRSRDVEAAGRAIGGLAVYALILSIVAGRLFATRV